MSRSQAVSTAQAGSSPFYAGKNKIINGDFNIWQRGTSFNGTGYTADRWLANLSGATATYSQQSFTAGTAPVAGYESTYFLRIAVTGADDNAGIVQRIEDVRTFAGQTVTVSFWAKGDTSRTVQPVISQNFGSGGSTQTNNVGSNISITSSWARYSQTFTVNSISGKTIGAGNYLEVNLRNPNNETSTIDYWGVQLEAGSVATAFQTATGTLQGELAACQRYYYRTGANDSAAYGILTGTGWADDTTSTIAILPLPVTMRVAPTAVDYPTLSTLRTYGYGGAQALTALTLGSQTSANFVYLDGTNTSTITAGAVQYLTKNNSATAYIGVTAEL